MTNPATDPVHAARMIRSIKSTQELDGYQAQAKERGIAPHEATLIAERRRELERNR